MSLHEKETLVTWLHETDYEHLQRICVLLLDPFSPGYLKIFLLFRRVSQLSVPRVLYPKCLGGSFYSLTPQEIKSQEQWRSCAINLMRKFLLNAYLISSSKSYTLDVRESVSPQYQTHRWNYLEISWKIPSYALSCDFQLSCILCGGKMFPVFDLFKYLHNAAFSVKYCKTCADFHQFYTSKTFSRYYGLILTVHYNFCAMYFSPRSLVRFFFNKHAF